MTDLRTALRRAFEKEQRGTPPPAALRADVMAAVAARDRRDDPRVQLAFAAAVLVAIIVVVQIVTSGLANRKLTPAGPGSAAERCGCIAFTNGTQIIGVDPARRGERIVVAASGSYPMAWSRDGTKLLVTDARETYQGTTRISTGGSGIYLVNVADGSARQVIGPAVPGVSGVSFSPDARMVAYTNPGVGLSVRDLASDASAVPRVLDRDTSEPLSEAPAWSPDGSRIAFLDFVEDSPTYGHHAFGLSFVNPDGSGLRKLAAWLPAEEGRGLVWSPDGSRLAFFMAAHTDWTPWMDTTKPPPSGWLTPAPDEIFVINADGSGLRRLTYGGDSRWPAWSPDGSRLAFVRQGAVYTVAADGSDVRQIEGVTTDGPIAWNPVHG
jgi:Tol biopolymer transport system component